MHPLGCFGSTLALAPKSKTCGGCSALAECTALVDGRRPLFLRLLDKFLDGQGNSMALPWKTPAERKQLREAADMPYVPPATNTAVMAFKVTLDSRTRPMLNRLTKMGIDPASADLDRVGDSSRTMRIVIDALRTRPQRTSELVALVARDCDLSAQSAQRDTYATVQILTACDRVERRGQILELK